MSHFFVGKKKKKKAVVLQGTFCFTLFSSVLFYALIVRRPVLNHMVLLLSEMTLVFLQLEHRLSLTDPTKVMMVIMIMMVMSAE